MAIVYPAQHRGGGILIMTLVFVVMFVTIFGALVGLVTRTYHEAVLQAQDETAFQVAEAGLNYARWRLAHQPDDLTAETRPVADQFAGDLGTYDLKFAQPQAGNTTVVITSTGRTANQPTREARIRARYGIPSLARYAYITNSDVWYGSTLKGAVHSNGGIRMDGQSDSLMTSAKEQYVCQPRHGCNNVLKPGIWGTGEKKELWEFPVAPVDYASLTLDLLAMKNAAEAAGTSYGPSGVFGYHVLFNADNTYSLYRVTRKGPNIPSWFPEDGRYVTGSHDIGQEVLLLSNPVPAGGVIFVEDTVWVNGEIRDRVTVAAGRFPDAAATNVDVILNGNISYGGVKDGSRVLGVVAQRHVLIPWSAAPDRMQLDGAFIAQKGRFGRRHYPNCCGAQAHRLKTSITRYGMTASNLVPVTTWLSGSTVVSGFRSGSSSYDPNLLYGPPPYFPVEGEYEFISWEELSPGEE